MTPTKLEIRPDPGREGCARLESSYPANPFYTHAYVEFRRRRGFEPFLLLEWAGGDLASGCTAFLRSGRVTRSLEISSVPTPTDPEVFWDAVRGYCRSESIQYLQVNSFASRAAPIPDLDGLRSRDSRYEYVLDLEETDLRESLSANHRRNADKAVKTGLELRRRSEVDAVAQHVSLIAESMQRRRERGEDVPDEIPRAPLEALVESGCGEFFQACEDGVPLSSALLLRARDGAYYQSAGTGPRGRSCGASHFTVHKAAVTLQQEGVGTFNLGGVDDPTSGLARFKSSFGGDRVELASATFYYGSTIHRTLEKLRTSLRNSPLPFPD